MEMERAIMSASVDDVEPQLTNPAGAAYASIISVTQNLHKLKLIQHRCQNTTPLRLTELDQELRNVADESEDSCKQSCPNHTNGESDSNQHKICSAFCQRDCQRTAWRQGANCLESSVAGQSLGQFEPDWRRYESMLASDLLPKMNLSHWNEKEMEATEFKKLNGHTVDPHSNTTRFVLEVVDMLLDFIHKSNDRTCKVLDFHHPDHLREMMGHCIDLFDTPQNLEQILSDCKETLKYCVKTGHPHYCNQLSTGLDMISLVGDWLTATTNTNMFTYEIAPVFTLMEDVVLSKMREHIGWPMGTGDGIFAPGGAISNLYAVTAARYNVLPECKTKGLRDLPQLVMFTSDQSHYSVNRSASLLGIGTDNVIVIKSDSRGKMLVDELDQKIEEAKAASTLPFIVSTTCGTTVLGAFDPINDVADVCEKHKIWLHVDAAWGGTALMSNKTKHLLSGIHRADSVTWNPHKLMGATLQCSAILLKKKGVLESCNSLKASYLFQPDKCYDVSYDTGDKTIQCGRHNDVFKLWLMWRAKGSNGFGQQVDHLMELSSYLQKQLLCRSGYKMVLTEPEFLNVCFWYIPSRIRHLPPGAEKDKLLHKVAPSIKAMMMEKGSLMVGYQPLGNLPNFFRMIVSNPALVRSDIDFILDEIEKLGQDL